MPEREAVNVLKATGNGACDISRKMGQNVPPQVGFDHTLISTLTVPLQVVLKDPLT
jgi:hypothetical protein